MALLLGSTFAVKLPPVIGASYNEIDRYIDLHRDALLWQVWLQSLAALFSMGFALGLARRLRAAGEDQLASLTLLASVVFLTVALVTQAPSGALAQQQLTDPVAVRTLWVLATFTGAVILQFPFAAFIFAPSLAIVKTGAMPRWVGWVGLVVGVYEIICTVAIVFRGKLAPGGFFSVSGYVAFALWMLVV
jgi:hypothetical protein